AEFGRLSGRFYDFVEVYGDEKAEAGIVALNTAAEACKDAVDRLRDEGRKVKVIVPYVLRPWPDKEIVEAIGETPKILVAERVSQYGAGNYLQNEIGASLQKKRAGTELINRVYGVGGLNFRMEDALKLFDIVLKWPDVPDEEKSDRWYYGAWKGDLSYKPAQTMEPLKADECTMNSGDDKINLKKLAAMPMRFDKHTACPGCGIFTNLDLFLKGIDGHVVFFFNTGCGMVVTTGYPLTSFKVPYFHNLFHNASSSAAGVAAIYNKLRKEGKIDEEITFIAVSGDGGNDIGMDQVIGCALRNDPIIVLEYDNKGYMNTGGQLCYTNIKGQKSTNAPVG
ncbi:MAG: pyruvate synthase, partial [Deltaproteobacteria bacterium]|nr:pyruvate synthase [Deltaproteobacteria bacterium]